MLRRKGTRRATVTRVVIKHAPKAATSKLVRHALRNPRQTIKRVKTVRKWMKRAQRVDVAKTGKWHPDEEQLRERGGEVVQPKFMFLTSPITAPIAKWLNEKLPFTRKPKPTFKRKRGPNERELK